MILFRFGGSPAKELLGVVAVLLADEVEDVGDDVGRVLDDELVGVEGEALDLGGYRLG